MGRPCRTAIRIEAHSSIRGKDDFLQAQQEILLEIFNIVKQYSSGPAWPVLNTVGEDNRPWMETAGELEGLPAPSR